MNLSVKNMDKKSKMLLMVIVFVAIISLGYTYYKTIVLQDFEIVDTTPQE